MIRIVVLMVLAVLTLDRIQLNTAEHDEGVVDKIGGHGDFGGGHIGSISDLSNVDVGALNVGEEHLSLLHESDRIDKKVAKILKEGTGINLRSGDGGHEGGDDGLSEGHD